MKHPCMQKKVTPETWLAFGMGVGVALGVLAATVASGVWLVRGLVREQIARRDADALHATMQMEQLDAVGQGEQDLRSDEQVGFDAAIRASRLKGVLGIRFYGADGNFTDAFPATILPRPLSKRERESMSRLEPCSRFNPDTPLSSVFIYLPQFADGHISRVPIMEVTVPLHRRETDRLVGSAQFVIEGNSIAAEYARLDRRLTGFAFVIFGVAGTVLVGMLWPAFRRVQNLHCALVLRSERLQRANEELALAARASAVGAVSAHLMHGLKNPLASLSHFVSSRGHDEAEPEPDEWQDALSASQRMQSLVEQTLEVLGDVRGGPVYELTVGELLEEIEKRVADEAQRRGVKLRFEAAVDGMLSSRVANLCILILVNLLENGIGVTSSGASVSLFVERAHGMLRFRVCDEGPGFPDSFRDQLFLPCKSSHEGGSGIGLAISKQIADYLEARLVLEESTKHGCCFLLELPEAAGLKTE